MDAKRGILNDNAVNDNAGFSINSVGKTIKKA